MTPVTPATATPPPAGSPRISRWVGVHGVLMGMAVLLLWPVISGASWLSALMIWSLGIRTIFPHESIERDTEGLTWVWVLWVYALGTGLALRWMARRPVPGS